MAAPVNDSMPATGTGHGGVRPRRVALFLSCAVDFAMPRAGTAAQRILEAMGIEVVVPPAQSCCGQVALNSGHTGPARMLSRHWVDTFAPFDAVVSPSGSCVATVHHGIQRLAEEGWADEAREVAGRTWELTQFLAEYGADLPMALDARVAWHDSCHMLRTLGEKESPRTVLQRIEGLELHEVADSESCCGFGGTFATKFPELSCTMADRKLRTAAEADLTYLVSADPGCLLHLGGRAENTAARVPTIHIAELVLQAMDGSPATTGRVQP
ncbi:MAG: (Fe-S)-binding protein [Ornithinimicrobium sp.]|uniref:(Fe-S)-binding protein n=1 Tax=Ornithinimicrobium sp. TaxID=1977084 RepID=UPI003D9BEAF3